MDIFEAIQNSNKKKVKSILRKKSHLINKKRGGETPLHIAAEKGLTDIITLLLKHGADLDNENLNGWTPLYSACHFNQYEAVLMLLDYGADINMKCKLGNTLLHAAAINGNVSIMQTLIYYNVSINATNIDNWTPLHRAAYSNKINATTFLLIEGADANTKTLTGRTAYDLAINMRYYDLADLINQHGKSDETKDRLSKQDNNFKQFLSGKNGVLTKLFRKSPIENREVEQTLAIPSPVQNKSDIFKESVKRTQKCLGDCRIILARKKDVLRDYSSKMFVKRPSETKTDANIFKKENEIREYTTETADDSQDEDENECPVCFEVPLPPVHIYQCTNGHLYCGNCKSKPNMSKCPQCGINISGLQNRNRYAEESIAKKYSKKTKT